MWTYIYIRAGRREVLKDLMDTFPKVQFIVSTHAPEVINSIKSESIIILKDNRAVNTNEETYGKDANTILREVMEVSSRPDDVRQLLQIFIGY